MAGFTGTLPDMSSITQPHFYGTNTLNLKGAGGDGTGTQAWVPEIFSKNVLMRFRRESVVEGITNNDYFGEIAAYGDSVRIIKEPTIAISDYARRKTIVSSDYQDSEITLVLDQAHSFQFEVDDLETKLSHVNWETLASSAATYNMKMAYDLNVLKYFHDEMLTQMIANRVVGDAYHDMFVRRGQGASTTAIAAATTIVDMETALIGDAYTLTNGTPATGEINPLTLLNKLNLYLDKQDVPEEGRYIVVGPEFIELLNDVDSKLINIDYRGGSASLKNGLVAEDVRGFKVYKTNNATSGLILGGHVSAVATANSIVETEKFRSHDNFSDVVRGLHVFGRAKVRDEALVAAYVLYP